MLGLNKPSIGRHKTRSLVPLPDIKSKKKHAKLQVDDDLPGDARRRIPAGTLEMVPYNGKPVLALLGRSSHRHKLPTKVTPGAIFGIGRSLIRVIYVGVHAAAASSSSSSSSTSTGGGTLMRSSATGVMLEVLEDDATKFQRALAKANKRQAKLAAQEAMEAAAAAAAAEEDEEEEEDEEQEQNEKTNMNTRRRR